MKKTKSTRASKKQEEEKKQEESPMEVDQSVKKENFGFQAKYFELDDGSGMEVPDGEKTVYAQFEACLTREQYIELMGQPDEKEQYSNKGKYLFLFNDRSGSMYGRPIEALKQANLNLCDTLYVNDDEPSAGDKFEEVHLVFFGTNPSDYVARTKKDFQKLTNSITATGAESFNHCHRIVEAVADRAPSGSEMYVIFMTDGCDTMNPKPSLNAS